MSNFGGLVTGKETLEELIYIVGNLQEQIAFKMNRNLTSKNVREIGDWIVTQYSIKSRDGQVGISSAGGATDPTAIRFYAGDAVMEDAPFRVNQAGEFVSTAGEIGGWIIAVNGLLSSLAAYPRVELVSDGKLVGVYSSASGSIVLGAYNNTSGAPYFTFTDEGDSATIDLILGSFNILSNVDMSIKAPNIEIRADGGDIVIYPAYSSGKQIIIPFFDTLYADQEGKTLQQALDDKAEESEVVTAQATADAAQSDATAALALAGTKQDSFSGFTGTQLVITSVDFGLSTTTSKTLHFTNGVVTSIT